MKFLKSVKWDLLAMIFFGIATLCHAHFAVTGFIDYGFLGGLLSLFYAVITLLVTSVYVFRVTSAYRNKKNQVD